MSAAPGQFGAGDRARRRHIDTPQPTEPYSIGRTFHQPAPARPSRVRNAVGQALFAIALGLVGALILTGMLTR